MSDNRLPPNDPEANGNIHNEHAEEAQPLSVVTIYSHGDSLGAPAGEGAGEGPDASAHVATGILPAGPSVGVDSTAHAGTLQELSLVTIDSHGESLLIPAVHAPDEGSGGDDNIPADSHIESLESGADGRQAGFRNSLRQSSRAAAELAATPTGHQVAQLASLPDSLPASPSVDGSPPGASATGPYEEVHVAPSAAAMDRASIIADTPADAVTDSARPPPTGLEPGSLPGSVEDADARSGGDGALQHAASHMNGGGSAEITAAPAGTAPRPSLAARSPAPHQPLVVNPEITPESQELDEQAELQRLRKSQAFTEECQKDPGFTLLHFVAMLGHVKFVDAIEAGKSERTLSRFTRLARYLVERRDDHVFVTDRFGCTPLQLAAACGNKDMVSVLLELYKPPPPPPPQSMRSLDPNGSHENFDTYINHQDFQIRFSALHGAVSHGETDVVIMLLKNGANPQVLDVNRKTAFKVAPRLSSLQDLLQRLLQDERGVPMEVIVQLMAEVLEQENAERPTKAAAAVGAPLARSATAVTASMAQTPALLAAAAAAAASATTPVAFSSAPGQGSGTRGVAGAPRGGRGLANWAKAQAATRDQQRQARKAGQRFLATAREVLGSVKSVSVCSGAIRLFFTRLYNAQNYNEICHYLKASVESNHYRLTEMMIDLICDQCPAVLKAPELQRALEPLVSSFPSLFHRLLLKLQGMRDEDVEGFVIHLRPELFMGREQDGPAPLAQQQPDGAAAYQGSPARSYASAILARRPLSAMNFRPNSAQGTPQPTSSQPGSAADMRPTSAHPGQPSSSRSSPPGGGAADRMKLLIYQQLVEGLKAVSYRVIKNFIEKSDETLLHDMAQFPVFRDFVGLVADRQTAEACSESDSNRRVLSDSNRRLLLELLRQASCQGGPAPAAAAGPASIAQEPPRNAAAAASPSRQAAWSAQPSPLSTRRTIHAWSPHDPQALVPTGSGERALANGTVRPNSVVPVGSFGGIGLGCNGLCNGVAAANSPSQRPGAYAQLSPVDSGQLPMASEPSSVNDAAVKQRARLALQTLNVERVLWAAVRGGKSDNVEAAVESIVRWVDTNSRGSKAVFLMGITPELIKELAEHFPTECATLLNLVSREVLEQLGTLQVSATLLNGRDHLVKCSTVRNHFTWRQKELQNLKRKQGYDEHVVDALVDYGVPFECVYKAAVQLGTTPADFAALIEAEFSGPELKQLISNNIKLAKIQGFLEECAQPPPTTDLPAAEGEDLKKRLDEVPMSVLLREMLREKLNPRIVDTIMREVRMFETTKYNNFRPGRPLPKTYPKPLFDPRYTYHFVQMLLINWRRGGKDANGKPMPPWDKRFIDTVWEPNDPLSTRLKSMYDNKLTDTQVYIQGDGATDGRGTAEQNSAEEQRQKRERQEREQGGRDRAKLLDKLLWVFVSNWILLHRWPVFLMARLYLWLLALWRKHAQHRVGALTRWWSLRDQAPRKRSGTVDCAVLAFPILNFVDPGAGDILTALADANCPASWFHFAIVRALYGLHWGQFGRFMIYLNAATHAQFAAAFLSFFVMVLVRRARFAAADDDGGDSGEGGLGSVGVGGGGGDADWTSTPLRSVPAIQAMLCISVALSASMLVERVTEFRIYTPSSWVVFGRRLELCCHAMVWGVAVLVWSNTAAQLVPALSGLAMLLFVLRLSLFGLITEALSTAVLALLEILWDSRYFFLLIATVYSGFALAAAGLRTQETLSMSSYTTVLFTVLLGDFQSTQLTDDRTVWLYPGFSTFLLSVYAVLMLIVFMNLLIATMNDTYDRVKEFREVEVMRLRTHMMVFVKKFMQRNAKGLTLPTLNGDVLHLLLRPEDIKSGRWVSQPGADPTEFTAWEGRISYMRSAIAREVEGVVRDVTDRTAEQLQSLAATEGRTLDTLQAMAARLGALEALVSSLRES